MRRVNLAALLLAAALFTGLGVTSASAEGMKCGAGKCGNAKPVKSSSKCGEGKKASKSEANKKSSKCGDGKSSRGGTKCGANKKASKCGGNK